MGITVMLTPVRHLRHFWLVGFVFRGKISLCVPDRPGTPSVNKPGLKLRDPPASAYRVLEKKGVPLHFQAGAPE